MIGLLPDMPPDKAKFQTARTRKFRASALSEKDERTIIHVEEFGCSVVNVTRTKYGLGGRTPWAFSIPAANPKSSLSDYYQKPHTLC
jgi:hypothetical protein